MYLLVCSHCSNLEPFMCYIWLDSLLFWEVVLSLICFSLCLLALWVCGCCCWQHVSDRCHLMFLDQTWPVCCQWHVASSGLTGQLVLWLWSSVLCCCGDTWSWFGDHLWARLWSTSRRTAPHSGWHVLRSQQNSTPGKCSPYRGDASLSGHVLWSQQNSRWMLTLQR